MKLKEKFLLEIKGEHKVENTIVTANKDYMILGLPFFNAEERMEDFEKKDERLAFDENLDFPFILFADFDKSGLFDLLDTMRENNLAIQHKASETANNVNWTLRELLIENDKEGKMMGLINNINKLLEKAKSLKEIHGEDPKLKNLVNEINAYFNDQTLFDFEVAKKYYLKLLDEILRIEEETK